jgi:hypothetical protein
MSWIRIVGPAEAKGALREIYQRIAGPGGQVDNVLQIHSLRLHIFGANMSLYKNVLHHCGNSRETNEFGGASIVGKRDPPYPRELTWASGSVRESAIDEMRCAGLSDGDDVGNWRHS